MKPEKSKLTDSSVWQSAENSPNLIFQGIKVLECLSLEGFSYGLSDLLLAESQSRICFEVLSWMRQIENNALEMYFQNMNMRMSSLAPKDALQRRIKQKYRKLISDVSTVPY